MQQSLSLKGENKMRHRKAEYRKRWLAKKKKLNDEMATRDRVQFQINKILSDTGITQYALARVLQVSKTALRNWHNGLVVPHPRNRKRIEDLFNQRSLNHSPCGETYVSLTTEQKDLIHNPKPLRTHKSSSPNDKRRKPSMAERESVLDRLTTGFLKKLWG